jgi:hypothetical protein
MNMRGRLFFYLRWNNARSGASTVNASEANQSGARKTFFFEKKNQKTFMSSAAARSRLNPRVTQPEKIKVFCFFSSEKKSLPCLEPTQGGSLFLQPI